MYDIIIRILHVFLSRIGDRFFCSHIITNGDLFTLVAIRYFYNCSCKAAQVLPVFFCNFFNLYLAAIGFITKTPRTAANSAPSVLNSRSYQSAPLYLVNVDWAISIAALNVIGAMIAPQMMLLVLVVLCVIWYSNQRIEQKPAYIQKCAILSRFVTLGSFSLEMWASDK